MGLYDNRCMLTGVSLRGSDAALVLLQRTGTGYHPIALPVHGHYDRGGAVDGIPTKDPNTRLLLKFFLGKLKTGEFVVDEHKLRVTDRWPINTLERVIWNFERFMNNGQPCALNGRPIVFSLICRGVWDAVVAADRTNQPATVCFQELFGDTPIADEIYRGNLTNVSRPLRELAAVTRFLDGRGLRWKPTPADGAQHDADEMLRYLKTARRTFADAAAVLAGLDDYEQEVDECLRPYDITKIDDAVFALLILNLGDRGRAGTRLPRAALDRLYAAGYIGDPHESASSVELTEAGWDRADEVVEQVFGRRRS